MLFSTTVSKHSRIVLGKNLFTNAHVNSKRIQNKKQLTQVALVQAGLFHNSATNSVFLKLVQGHGRNRFNKSSYFQKDHHILKEVYLESGAIMSMPKWIRGGLIKITTNIIVFIIVGVLISRTVVNFLDENDIFKPEDEDNDEDDD